MRERFFANVPVIIYVLMNFLNKFKYARDSYLITLLILFIVLMTNFIASHHFVRFDLTKNQLYALSDASKDMMRNLDDIVTVKIFFSETLPPNLLAVRQYVDDILDELVSYSKGNLIVEFLNPSEPDIINEALRFGIPQVQMNIVEKDKLEVKNGFLGIAVIYGDRVEILPVVQNILNVEYELAAAIKKVTAQQEHTVGFLVGHGEPGFEQSVGLGDRGGSYLILKEALERNYQVIFVDFERGDTLEGVDTLLIAGSKTSFSEEEKKTIDRFFINGGNLVVFLDSVDVTDSFQAIPLDQGLGDLFAHYGLNFEKQFVLDRSNEQASFSQGFVNFIMPYPFWVKAVHPYLDAVHPITAKLDSLVFPWASPLQTVHADGVNRTVLANTTLNAWLQEAPFDLNPSSIQGNSEKGQYPLAVMMEGAFSSFYQNNTKDQNISPGRLIAVGNSRFITDRFISQFPQNLLFAMNAVDLLTLDESLIGIRSKTSFDLPLKDLNARERQLVKLTGILLAPFLVILFGVGWFIFRRRQKITF